MPVITTPQESSWDSNVYVIATTRMLVLMGTAYLVRSLYNLVSAAGAPRFVSNVAATISGLGFEEVALDTLPTVPGTAGTDVDLEADFTLGAQLPCPSSGAQNQVQSSRASLQAHDQRMGNPESSIAAMVIPEQDMGVRHGTAHFEEHTGRTEENGG